MFPFFIENGGFTMKIDHIFFGASVLSDFRPSCVQPDLLFSTSYQTAQTDFNIPECIQISQTIRS